MSDRVLREKVTTCGASSCAGSPKIYQIQTLQRARRLNSSVHYLAENSLPPLVSSEKFGQISKRRRGQNAAPSCAVILYTYSRIVRYHKLNMNILYTEIFYIWHSWSIIVKCMLDRPKCFCHSSLVMSSPHQELEPKAADRKIRSRGVPVVLSHRPINSSNAIMVRSVYRVALSLML